MDDNNNSPKIVNLNTLVEIIYPFNSKYFYRRESLKRWRTESQGKKKRYIPKTCSVKTAQNKTDVDKIMHERFPKLQIMSVTVHNDAANHNSTVRDSFYISLIVYKRLIANLHTLCFRAHFHFFVFFINLKLSRFTVSRSSSFS